MEETNYPRLCKSRKNAIATSIHTTIEEFSGQLPQEKESLCLFYANLGMDLCTFIYQNVFQKPEIFYTLQCGRFSVRVSPDPNIVNQGLNFGANGVSLEEGQFHCWVIGPWNVDRLLQPYEFIDFTSRFYKENSIKQGFEWNRNDIGDYIWIEGQDICDWTEIGISFDGDQRATEKVIQDWSKNSLQKEMLLKSIQNYQKLISLSL